VVLVIAPHCALDGSQRIRFYSLSGWCPSQNEQRYSFNDLPELSQLD
jgi:hypothetical protein